MIIRKEVINMETAKIMREYTIEDIYNLPEGKRAELIDGVIYDMAAPSRIHQKLVSRLNQKIANYIDSKNGECEVYPAPFAVFLNADDKTYVEPDISVICDREKLNDEGCKGAPDWIIEIVSPSNAGYDYIRKLNLYTNAGVKEYWIVDPEKKKIIVYNFSQDAVEIYTFNDIVKAGIYEDLEIDFSELNME